MPGTCELAGNYPPATMTVYVAVTEQLVPDPQGLWSVSTTVKVAV
jgi:hypothetical protein